MDSLDLARRIAASTAAILPAVHGMVAADLHDHSLVALDFRKPWMQTSYQLLQRRDRTPSPAVSEFVQELRAVEAEIGAGSARPASGVSTSIHRSQAPGHPRTSP